MHSLSDMPVELLDIILCRLYYTPEGLRGPVKDFKALHQVLLLNKRFFSIAVKHLYQDITPMSSDLVKAKQLYSTLLCAAKNKTSVPYCEYAEEFALDKRCERHDLEIILRAILQHGQLRGLAVEFPQYLPLIATLPNFDGTTLKRLKVAFFGKVVRKDPQSLSRIKALTSQMHLESLEVDMYCPHPLDWDFPSHTLLHVSLQELSMVYYNPPETWEPQLTQKNGIILSSYTKRILASQYQTLTSLSLSGVTLDLTPGISLSKLQKLRLRMCRVTGWENLCMSLAALTSLELLDVYFSDNPDFAHPELLEELRVARSWCPDSNGLACLLEDHSKSFRSLRVLDFTGFMSTNTMATILSKNPHLAEFEYRYSAEEFGSDDDSLFSDIDEPPPPDDDYLEVISQLAPAKLKRLTITFGNYSSEGLSSFIASFPASIDSLNLDDSAGLTTGHLHALLQMPLDRLSLDDIKVEDKHWDEMEKMASDAEKIRDTWKFTYSIA